MRLHMFSQFTGRQKLLGANIAHVGQSSDVLQHVTLHQVRPVERFTADLADERLREMYPHVFFEVLLVSEAAETSPAEERPPGNVGPSVRPEFCQVVKRALARAATEARNP